MNTKIIGLKRGGLTCFSSGGKANGDIGNGKQKEGNEMSLNIKMVKDKWRIAISEEWEFDSVDNMNDVLGNLIAYKFRHGRVKDWNGEGEKLLKSQ